MKPYVVTMTFVVNSDMNRRTMKKTLRNWMDRARYCTKGDNIESGKYMPKSLTRSIVFEIEEGEA